MNTLETKETYNVNLSENGIQIIGTVKFDDMDNASVSIKVNGEVLTETKLSPIELRVLRSYFSRVTK
jgi:hypothetical protein